MAAPGDKVLPFLPGVPKFGVVKGVLLTKQRCKSSVKIYELVANVLPCAFVSSQDSGFGNAFKDQGDLPRQIIRVGHAYIHSLACFGTVGVACIAKEEDSLLFVCKVLNDALSDVIATLPENMFDIHPEGCQNSGYAVLDDIQ